MFFFSGKLFVMKSILSDSNTAFPQFLCLLLAWITFYAQLLSTYITHSESNASKFLFI